MQLLFYFIFNLLNIFFYFYLFLFIMNSFSFLFYSYKSFHSLKYFVFIFSFYYWISFILFIRLRQNLCIFIAFYSYIFFNKVYKLINLGFSFKADLSCYFSIFFSNISFQFEISLFWVDIKLVAISLLTKLFKISLSLTAFFFIN